MEELQYQVIVDAKLECRADGVLAFGDFEVTNGAVYPDDGLQAFYEDLILGRAFPLTVVTRGLDTIGKLVAVSFFLSRDLVLHPNAASLVMSASLADKLGMAGLAHMDRDLARFFRLLSGYLPKGLSRGEQRHRLATAVGWIHDYLKADQLPALPIEPALPRVIDAGSGGFVLAEAPKVSEVVWIELYRQGFLKGCLVARKPHSDRRKALVARKSIMVDFDLGKAAAILNDAEAAMGEPQEWEAGELWLRAPKKGSMLPITSLVEVLVRV